MSVEAIPSLFSDGIAAAVGETAKFLRMLYDTPVLQVLPHSISRIDASLALCQVKRTANIPFQKLQTMEPGGEVC